VSDHKCKRCGDPTGDVLYKSLDLCWSCRMDDYRAKKKAEEELKLAKTVPENCFEFRDKELGMWVKVFIGEGRVEFSPGLELDEAARVFWDAVAMHIPGRTITKGTVMSFGVDGRELDL